MALQITDANFEELINSGKPMVLDFWAECVALAAWSGRSSMNWLPNMKAVLLSAKWM